MERLSPNGGARRSNPSPEPLISVLMPVFNGAKYMEEAIASVCNQTVDDFEFLIINDGSTDDTAKILERRQKTDKRIKVIEQENSGIIGSLNLAVSLARGEYFARMDADDISKPDRFAKQLRYLEANPSVIAVGGAVEFIDETGHATGRSEVRQTPSEIREALKVCNCIAHPTVLMRREIFEKITPYRKAFAHAEDYDLWLRVSEFADLANIPDVVLCYRHHNENISIRRVTEQLIAACAAGRAAEIRRRGEPDPTNEIVLADRDCLNMLGMSISEIDDVIVDGLLTFSRESIKAGDPSILPTVYQHLSQYLDPKATKHQGVELYLFAVLCDWRARRFRSAIRHGIEGVRAAPIIAYGETVRFILRKLKRYLR